MKKFLLIPNLISLLRIVLTPIFIIMLFAEEQYLIGAIIIFTIAAISDLYDGQVARRNKTISNLGIFLDPLADKILLSGIFISFYLLHLVNFWSIFIILSREILITCLRMIAISQKQTMTTLNTGKIKTVIQFTAIYLMLIYMLINYFFKNPMLNQISFAIATIAIYIAVIFTAYSGLIYLLKNRKVIKSFFLPNFFYELISTCCYIGYVPYGPGTVTSFVTVIIFFLLPEFLAYQKILFLIFTFILGIFTSEKFSKKLKESDPSCIVIDEVCGMALTLFWLQKTIFYYLLGFLIFRFFDITKIPFINKIEKKFDSGFGIMIDDVIAATFSLISIETIKYLQLFT